MVSFFLLRSQSLDYRTVENSVCAVFVCENDRDLFSSPSGERQVFEE